MPHVLIGTGAWPAAVIAAWRDGLPTDWSVVVLDGRGDADELVDQRTRVLPAPRTGLDAEVLSRCGIAEETILLCLADDGLLVCPQASFPIATDLCLVRTALPCPPSGAYAPPSFRRPEHYLAGALLSGERLAHLCANTPIALDRWLGHVIAWRHLTAGGRLGRLPQDWLVLPAPLQWSGRDCHKSRPLALPLLRDSVQSSTMAVSSRLTQALSVLERHTAPSAHVWDGEMAEADKATVDAALSDLTAELCQRLPPVEPPPPQPMLDHTAPLAVIKLDEIGDAVMATPALQTLRRAWQGEIRYLGSDKVRNLIETCPDVDRTLFIEGGGSLQNPAQGAAHLARWLPVVRRFLHGVAAAVILRPAADHYFALHFAVLAQVPRIMAVTSSYVQDIERFNTGYQASWSDRLILNTSCHEAQAMGLLVEQLGGAPITPRYTLTLTPDDQAVAMALLWEAGGQAIQGVGFGIGAQNGRRCWPADRFAAVAQTLCTNPRARIFLLGAAQHRPIGEAIVAGVDAGLRRQVLNMCGRTTLRQSVALLSYLQGFVGNDSGPLHLAAAAGIPVVEISCHPHGASPMHDNDPQRFGPLGVRTVIVQPAQPSDPRCAQGCVVDSPHCIAAVTVNEVLTACRNLFGSMIP